MHPKIGDEHILPGFNHGLYTSKEKQFHPDDLAESYLNTLSINIRKLGLMLNIWHLEDIARPFFCHPERSEGPR